MCIRDSISNATVNAGIIHGALANNFGNPDARVIVPGSLSNSMIHSRISVRGASQMPPLASSVLDTQAVALLSRWITNDLAGGWTNTIEPLTLGITATNGGGVLQFIHPANRAVRIESATNLNTPIQWRFHDVPGNRPVYPATSNTVTVGEATNAALKFFRARVTAP